MYTYIRTTHLLLLCHTDDSLALGDEYFWKAEWQQPDILISNFNCLPDNTFGTDADFSLKCFVVKLFLEYSEKQGIFM